MFYDYESGCLITSPDGDVANGYQINEKIEDLERQVRTLTRQNIELKKQQKEFIKYLEDYQDGASKSLDSYDCGINDCLEDVLSKYTKIIGFGQYTEK